MMPNEKDGFLYKKEVDWSLCHIATRGRPASRPYKNHSRGRLKESVLIGAICGEEEVFSRQQSVSRIKSV